MNEKTRFGLSSSAENDLISLNDKELLETDNKSLLP